MIELGRVCLRVCLCVHVWVAVIVCVSVCVWCCVCFSVFLGRNWHLYLLLSYLVCVVCMYVFILIVDMSFVLCACVMLCVLCVV